MESLACLFLSDLKSSVTAGSGTVDISKFASQGPNTY